MESIRTLDELLGSSAVFGGRTAFIHFYEEGMSEWSCEKMDRLSWRLAGGLRRRHRMAAGDAAAIVADNSPEWFCAALALLRSAIPLIPVESGVDELRLDQILHDSGARLVFASIATLPVIEKTAFSGEIVLLDGPELDPRHWKHISGFTVQPAPADPEEAACIYYPEDESGEILPAVLTRRDFAFHVHLLSRSIDGPPWSRIVVPVPFFRIYPLAGSLAAFSFGRPVILPRSPSAEDVFKASREAKATVMLGEISFYEELLLDLENFLGSSAAGKIFQRMGKLRIPGSRILLSPLHLRTGRDLTTFLYADAYADGKIYSRLQNLGWKVISAYRLEDAEKTSAGIPGSAKSKDWRLQEERPPASPAARADPLERPLEVLTEEQQKRLKPFHAFGNAVSFLLYGCNRLFVRLFFRIELKGRENIPADVPFIITSNHASFLDPFIIAAVLPYRLVRSTYWAGWSGIAYRNRFRRFLSRFSRVLPVAAGKGTFSSLAFASAVIGRGQGLVWFPEGHRSLTGELEPFKPGIGMLLNRFDVSVVPVFLSGTYQALPPERRFPRPGPISVVVGRPFESRQLRELAGEGKPYLRTTQALRDRMQSLHLAA